MNNTQIKRAAKKFIKALNGKTDFVSVEKYLNEKGYKVVFYNTPSGDREIERFNLFEKAQKNQAFTYTGTAKIVFIDNNVSSDDKNYLLYHETAHLELGHTEYERITTRNKFLMEFEADTFAQMVVNPAKTHRYNLLFAILVTLLLVLSFFAGTHFSGTQTIPVQSTIPSAPQNQYESLPEETPVGETVYITRTGTKYHNADCRYLKSSCIPISKKDAAENYSPCSVCKP